MLKFVHRILYDVQFNHLATTPLKDEQFTRHAEYGNKQLLLTAVTPLLTLGWIISTVV